MLNNYTVTNNETNLQFEVRESGEVAILQYRFHHGNMVLMHTYVPKPLEGKGIAGTLAKAALEYAKEKELKIIVYCSYVADYLTKHREYDFLKASA